MKRLPNKAADLRRCHRAINHLLAIRAGQDNPDIGPDLHGFGDDFPAGSPWSRHVEENRIDSATDGTKVIDCRSTIGRIEYLKSILTEHLQDRLAQVALVFHNQNSAVFRRDGELSVIGCCVSVNAGCTLHEWQQYLKAGAFIRLAREVNGAAEASDDRLHNNEPQSAPRGFGSEN